MESLCVALCEALLCGCDFSETAFSKLAVSAG